MTDTKEKILSEALKLFAGRGYEAVSVRDIAEKLGITKGALYKHYKNKQDIFDSIVAQMRENDFDRAREYEVPEDEFHQMEETYSITDPERIRDFTKAQFVYWTEDEFASDFRKMLSLEKYRTSEKMELYQNYLGSGPLEYMEDLFREMHEKNMREKNIYDSQSIGQKESDPKQMAVEFYAPVYMMMSVYDSVEDEKSKDGLIAAVNKHIDIFIDRLLDK